MSHRSLSPNRCDRSDALWVACRAGLPTGVAATTAVPPFVTDPVWNVSAVVRLGPLGNDSFFYVIAIVSDGDTFVLRSQSPPLKSGIVTSAPTRLPYSCVFSVVSSSFWVEQLPETLKPLDI